MSLIANGAGESADAKFYNDVGMKALRFDRGASATLARTPAGAGNRKTWTWSAWFKRGSLAGRTQMLFSTGRNDSTEFNILILDGDDRIAVGTSAGGLITTSNKFRDHSAWYHIVARLDTTQSTAVNRLKLYINGVETANDVNGVASIISSQNQDMGINVAAEHRIGSRINDDLFFDGYMSDVNFVDGTSLGPDSFGELKNGVWIAIEPNVTYGTNGFRLNFEDNAVDAPESEGTVDTDNIGADSSGEHNNWTSTGVTASDCATPDNPENNFATMNQSYVTNSNTTLSDGNLKQTSAAAWLLATSTIGFSSGKWYAELKMIDVTNFSFGIVAASGDSVANGNTANSGYVGKYADGYGWWGNGASAQTINNNSNVNYGANPSADDIFMLAVDMDNGDVFMGKEGTWFNSGNPANGTNPAFNNQAQLQDGSTWLIAGGFENANGFWNFGQNSVFDDESAGGNADGNGIGDFAYAPPSGYLALCTVNLPEPTIGPNSGDNEQATDYFNTVLYTGNGSGQTITGVGFQPDWTWNKNRATTDFNILQDSSRGAGKELFSNSEADEESYSTSITSWNSDGFVLGNREPINANNEAYVSWNWKANGATTSSNSDGSITSTVQATTTAGFSIVLYNGEGDGQATVGHGLGVKPQVVIPKNRGADGSFHMYHEGIDSSAPEDFGILLNAANIRSDDAGFHNDTAPTSSVFTVGTYNNIDNDYVAYCFAEIEGYSKFGSYIGNVNADGTFVYLGFSPAWVIVKRTTGGSTYNWFIHDNKRGASNVNKERLTSDTNEAEATGITSMDFLSNGFKIRTANTSYNEGTVIYMAFAEAPFKYANAR